MELDIDLVADLNARDDDDLGWSTLADASDPSRVRPGPCCWRVTGTAKPWSGWSPSMTTARCTSRSCPARWPRTATSCTGRSRRLRRTRRPTGTGAVQSPEFSVIVERLSRSVEPEYVSAWLHKPLAALGGEKPIAVIARGEFRRVNRLIAALESPIAS